MKPGNLVIIMSDEHNAAFAGFAGHPAMKTPHIDRLAREGTSFSAACTPSPICVPARAAFATGLDVHDTGYWDNAHPYDGRVRGWAHDLRDRGYDVVSIGKLHYRGPDIDSGLTEQILPMHVVNGVGDVLGSVRSPLPVRHKSAALAEKVGAGESDYVRYDLDIAQAAIGWLNQRQDADPSRPWVLFVSFVCPHFPLIAPQEYLDLYDPDTIDPPKPVPPIEEEHPWFTAFRKCFTHDDYFVDDAARRQAIASYMALCTFVDDNVGRVADAVRSLKSKSPTRLIYVSDHGDNLGARGMWGKSNFYEESVRVPLILVGDGVKEGKVSNTPVSLTDFHPTVLSAIGAQDIPSPPRTKSLWDIAAEPDDADRLVLSQYHAVAAAEAMYMIRNGRFKYCHYVNMPAQLFDLLSDPEEMNDLSGLPEHAGTCAKLEAELWGILDPRAVDQRAREDQMALIDQHGGVENVLARGAFGHTPAPGTDPDFVSATKE